MKYSCITQQKNTASISLPCQVLGVNRSGYDHYRANRANKPVDVVPQKMLKRVKALAKQSRDSYVSRRMKKALIVLGDPVTRDKTRKLMREAGGQGRHRKKFKVTTDSNHKPPVFPNLVHRQFIVPHPNQVYASDVTYIWTQEGWLSLAVVMDLCSREIVGGSMSSRMKAQPGCDALTMAIWQRRPQAGLIHHSDRGAPYASKAFRRLLNAHGLQGRMSRRGNCWDNAVVESFFGPLNQERVQWANDQTRDEAQQDVLNNIAMFYHRSRVHSYLGYISPNDFESQLVIMKNVA